ncbi:LacI family DNA-binding transcriptional regulator [Anaerotalea alkaliphila]|uniref:LacI family DNA-binding transcriptional regulator n=1 Tax=Anaerotalea alkaliphila TaxID=2662126 RepID=A0A7X5HVG5_9FIRM|nr:LacI family DNA-binding transcriptional regulator [Anaerotalea alkaliphila]NDL67386.1 LacI family DNA-binding transcriptional regulator [Anaerotalea alkaliphila]
MVTMKDVARHANISEATVSRVLNGDKTFSVSDETRQRIHEAVAALGYKPIRRRKKNAPQKGGEGAEAKDWKVGLLLTSSQEDELNDPYFMAIRLGIEKYCSLESLEIRTVVRTVGQLEEDVFAGLDGILVVGGVNTAGIPEVYGEGPVVVINNMMEYDERYDKVTSDLDRAVEKMVDYLTELGHQRIGFIGGEECLTEIPEERWSVVKDVRHAAFERKMQLLGRYNPEDVYIGEWSAADGNRLMQEAIAKGTLPTAFLVGSDPMSIGVIHALRAAGLRVPEDVGILSFDDIEAAQFVNPPLSTVRIDTEEMARWAVLLLKDRLEGRTHAVKVVVPSQLLVRSSCGGRNGD